MTVTARSTDISRASRSTFLCFTVLGLAFATWAAEIPRVKEHEHLSAGALGLVLLAIAGGSVCALPLSGLLVNRIRSNNAVAVAAAGQGLALALIALGYLVGLGMLVPSLLMFGFAMGIWDVAVNIQGAAIERATGRPILSRFHAGFSVGTVAGALLGGGAIALGIPAPVHLGVLGCVVIAIVPVSTRRFVDDRAGTPEVADRDSARSRPRFGAWTERRTVLIGLAVVGFAFAEGAGNDWLSVAITSGYDETAAFGSLGFACFLAAMTIMRWYSTQLLERFGRVTILRWLAGIGVLGVTIFAFSDYWVAALVGAMLWGVGASLGFPVGIGAAADDPEHAPQRVSVTVSMGYCAFLAGPPLIGFIADQVTIHRAVLVVAALLLAATSMVVALRPASGARADALPPVTPRGQQV